MESAHQEFKETSVLRVALIMLTGLLLSGCASTESNINSGLWHYNAGLYGEAIPRLLDATADFEKTNPTDERVSRSYLALGVMAENSKLYEKAETYLFKALKTAKSTSPFSQSVLRDAEATLGHFYLNRERYSEALQPLKNAEIISKNNQIDPLLNAIDLDNIGVALHGLAKTAESIGYSERALAIVEKNSTNDRYVLTKGIILFNLGKAYETSADIQKARRFYTQSVELLTIAVEQNSYEKWRLDAVQNELNDLVVTP